MCGCDLRPLGRRTYLTLRVSMCLGGPNGPQSTPLSYHENTCPRCFYEISGPLRDLQDAIDTCKAALRGSAGEQSPPPSP